MANNANATNDEQAGKDSEQAGKGAGVRGARGAWGSKPTASLIPLIAIMTAVTTVCTMLVKIPTPSRGYLNLSDTMIYFSSYAFGPWIGGIIGGLGPALSDLILGYPQWAIFTLLIDGIQAIIVGLSVRRFKPVTMIVGSVVAGVWKVLGYFLAGIVLSGLSASLVDVPGNLAQAGVGIVIGIALFSAVRKAYPPLVRLGNLGVNAAADEAADSTK